MSVAAMITNSQNEIEEKFYVPVASESFFEQCWQPAIDELGLQWVKVFSVGIDITKEDLPDLMNELFLLENWAKNKLQEPQLGHLMERVQQLKIKLPEAFQREDAVVFIG